MTLSTLLRARIAESGPLTFHDYMAAALYHPEHGYYASGRARVGRKGDFITSVSVGALFGRLLARQAAEVWDRLGRPAEFCLVEQGAHDGALAADVLGALPAECPARLIIVEPSPWWRGLQTERLRGRAVEWVTSEAELPPFVGLHYSNELLDAFPVHRLRRTEAGWVELGVTWTDRFAWTELHPTLDVAACSLPEVPVGNVVEIAPAARTWAATIGQKLQRGLVLLIDYGGPREELYAPHRTDGTLEAIAAHRRVDPLEAPGDADLTAHVDFSAVAEASGLEVLGWTDQHHFLVGLSRLHFVEGVPPDPQEMRAFQTLAHPTLLGRSFQVVGLGRDLPGPLSGWTYASTPRSFR